MAPAPLRPALPRPVPPQGGNRASGAFAHQQAGTAMPGYLIFEIDITDDLGVHVASVTVTGFRRG